MVIMFDAPVDISGANPASISIVVGGTTYFGTGFGLDPSPLAVIVEFGDMPVDFNTGDPWSWPTMAAEVTAGGKTLTGSTSGAIDGEQPTSVPIILQYAAWDPSNSVVRFGYNRGVTTINEPYDLPQIDTGDGFVNADGASFGQLPGEVWWFWSAVPSPQPTNVWSWPDADPKVHFTPAGVVPSTSGELGPDWNP
jgi:hypothetical protein